MVGLIPLCDADEMDGIRARLYPGKAMEAFRAHPIEL